MDALTVQQTISLESQISLEAALFQSRPQGLQEAARVSAVH